VLTSSRITGPARRILYSVVKDPCPTQWSDGRPEGLKRRNPLWLLPEGVSGTCVRFEALLGQTTLRAHSYSHEDRKVSVLVRLRVVNKQRIVVSQFPKVWAEAVPRWFVSDPKGPFWRSQAPFFGGKSFRGYYWRPGGVEPCDVSSPMPDVG